MSSHHWEIGRILTLESMMENSLELEYITKMRNMDFLADSDLQTIGQGFYHFFFVNAQHSREFHKCMHHAYLCHRESIIDVPSSEIPRSCEMLQNEDTGLIPNFSCYLVQKASATMRFVSVKQSQVIDSRMGVVSNGDKELVTCLPPTWRRTYSSSKDIFCCNAETTESFLRVQRQPTPKKENIWKSITKREIQGPLNQRALLERIASPYYYVFPYQDPEEYSELDWQTWNVPTLPRDYEVLSFRTFVVHEIRCSNTV